MRVQRMLFPVMSLLFLWPAVAQVSPYTPKGSEPPAKKVPTVKITEGPSLELYGHNEAIIRWTSDNPGGTAEHWGFVTYGTDPQHLNQTAKGHIRLNRSHTYTVFRVRVTDVKPRTTYYYTIGSMSGDGSKDNVKSELYHFTTPGGG